MHDLGILTDLVIAISASIVIVVVLQRLNLPSLLGFILAGGLVGPAGLGLVTDVHAIEVMAEIGIVLLMFTIGLEVSIEELARLASRVFGGGGAQIAITASAAAAIVAFWDVPLSTAIFAGLVVSASSTALGLRLLGDRGELGAPHGRFTLAVLLMQDMAVVIMMLLVPMLAGGGGSAMDVTLTVARSLLLILATWVLARFALPWVFRRAVALRSREVFTLITLVAVLGTAWLASELGLSLALGAFVAGLVVSESEFSLQVLAEIVPFRDVLNGLFFVSVGMLVSPDLLVSQPLELMGMVAGVIAAKALIVFCIARYLFRLSSVSAALAAVALGQVGEFGFVLVQQGAAAGILDETSRALFISVSVLTMAATPVLLLVARRLLPEPPSGNEVEFEADAHGDHDDHVIVVGFGINGRNVARALRQLGVDYVVVELNHATVRAARADGEPILFGDATRPALLNHLQVTRARALVVAISDASATRNIVSLGHTLNPDLLIVARTRFINEIEALHELGADKVVPEEFETSLELVGCVMRAYGASERAIEREQYLLRSAQYGLLRGNAADARTQGAPSIVDLLSGVAVEQIVLTDDDQATGCTLAELDLRARSGCTVIAVARDETWTVSPPATLRLHAGDGVIIVGTDEDTRRAIGLLGRPASQRAADA